MLRLTPRADRPSLPAGPGQRPLSLPPRPRLRFRLALPSLRTPLCTNGSRCRPSCSPSGSLRPSRRDHLTKGVGRGRGAVNGRRAGRGARGLPATRDGGGREAMPRVPAEAPDPRADPPPRRAAALPPPRCAAVLPPPRCGTEPRGKGRAGPGRGRVPRLGLGCCRASPAREAGVGMGSWGEGGLWPSDSS